MRRSRLSTAGSARSANFLASIRRICAQGRECPPAAMAQCRHGDAGPGRATRRCCMPCPIPRCNSVLARVIGRANRPFLQTMILDAGRNQHVKPGEAVMDARGMIGRIYLAGERTSWVILLTDLNSRIPVTITASSAKASNIPAIMTGDNSAARAGDGLRTVTLHAGDQVTSSGDGGLLPAGFPSAPWSRWGGLSGRASGRRRVQRGCRGAGFPMPRPNPRRRPAATFPMPPPARRWPARPLVTARDPGDAADRRAIDTRQTRPAVSRGSAPSRIRTKAVPADGPCRPRNGGPELTMASWNALVRRRPVRFFSALLPLCSAFCSCALQHARYLCWLARFLRRSWR